MKRASRLVAVVLAVALLLPGLAIPIGAAAQETEIGSAVPVTDEEGAPVGSITVTEVVDPFEDFDPAYPPEAGARYVMLTVAIDADAGERFDFAPYTVVLQDDLGFLWNPTTIYQPDDVLVPELSSETLAPGSRVTGTVGFTLPEGNTPARVFYQPESSRLVTLAELIDVQPPALGETVEIVDSEGGVGSVTVTEVVDPFEDVDPGTIPPEASRFVMTTLMYENPGDGRFFVEPSGLLLRDANGDLWSSTYVPRPAETTIVPDLARTQLAPGDRVSGAVVFAVPTETGLTGLYTSPVSGQLLQLADLGEGAGADEESASASADTTEVATSETTDVALADSCADLEQWLASTRERIAAAGTMSVDDATLSDLEGMAEHVAAYAALAEEQLQDAAPPEAEAAGKALVATLSAYGESLDQILTAEEPGKDLMLELTEGMNTFNDAGTRIRQIEEELTRLASDCGLA